MLSSILIYLIGPGIWCDASLRIVVRTQDLFSILEVVFFSAFPFFVFLLYRYRFSFLRLTLVRCGIVLIVTAICNLMRIGGWAEPRFVFACKYVCVLRNVDGHKTSGKLVLLGCLIGESQLRLPKFGPDLQYGIIHVKLEYYKSCVLKSPSVRVSVVIIRWSTDVLHSPVQELAGYIELVMICVSQLDRNSQLFQIRICYFGEVVGTWSPGI